MTNLVSELNWGFDEMLGLQLGFDFFVQLGAEGSFVIFNAESIFDG